MNEIQIPTSLIANIDYHLSRFSESRHEVERAHHLIELYNRVSDLKTWHPEYDERTGMLPWELGENDDSQDD